MEQVILSAVIFVLVIAGTVCHLFTGNPVSFTALAVAVLAAWCSFIMFRETVRDYRDGKI